MKAVKVPKMSGYRKVKNSDLSLDLKTYILKKRMYIEGERTTVTSGIKVMADDVRFIDDNGTQLVELPPKYLNKAKFELQKVDVKKRKEEHREQRTADNMTVADAWPRYFAHKTQENKKGSWKPASVVNAKSNWKHLEEFWGDKRLKDLVDEDWEDYEVWMEENRPNIQLLSGPRCFLTGLLTYCRRQGWMTKHLELPMSEEARLMEEPDDFYIVSEEEEKVWLEEAAQQSLGARYDFELFCLLLSRYGMRPMEIYALKKSRVNLLTNQIELKGLAKRKKFSDEKEDSKTKRNSDTKNNKSRSLPLFPKDPRFKRLYDLLMKRVRSNDGSDYVFPGVIKGTRLTRGGERKLWVRTAEETCIKITPYDFRHTLATRMHEQGVPPAHAAYWLGHSVQTYLRRYVHSNANERTKVFQQFIHKNTHTNTSESK